MKTEQIVSLKVTLFIDSGAMRKNWHFSGLRTGIESC